VLALPTPSKSTERLDKKRASGRPTFDVRRSTFDVRRSTFDVRRSTFDVRRSTFDVRRRAGKKAQCDPPPGQHNFWAPSFCFASLLDL
jgi:hypothetical protein